MHSKYLNMDEIFWSLGVSFISLSNSSNLARSPGGKDAQESWGGSLECKIVFFKLDGGEAL